MQFPNARSSITKNGQKAQGWEDLLRDHVKTRPTDRILAALHALLVKMEHW